jgi:hypothetical protein
MSEILNKIKAELDIFAAKKRELVEELRKQFPQLFVELFNKSKCIESVSWTQYTPYFNDGEECVFSVHTDWLNVNDEDYYDRDEIEGWDESEEAIIKEIKTVLGNIPEDFFRELFGDHAQITLKKNGEIVVTEYDHE